MQLRKYMGASLLALVTAFCVSTAMPATALADEAADPAAAAPAAESTDSGMVKWDNPYTYTSAQYGYSITCPQKPVGVIPASALSEDARGDVLVFSNDGYNIQRAWLILYDAFTDAEIPTNLGKLSETEQKALIDRLQNKSGYEFARIADINGNKGVYAVTAKVMEIDTNGDGKPDETATSDTQMIKTFFRGEYGGHFAVELIDNPELTKAGIADYNAGILTFKEWPTRQWNGQNVQKGTAQNYKSKKSKK